MIYNLFDILSFLYDISYSLIILGITSVIIYIIKYIRNWRRIKKFPIGNNFMSTYEDIVDNTGVSLRAIVDISQKGKDFKGFTSVMNKSSKEWSIKGEIVENIFLLGKYRSENPRYPSFGSFCLKPIYNGGIIGSYDGFWIGHSPDNGDMLAGKYFWKKLVDIKIKRIKRKDGSIMAAINGILDNVLGKWYVEKSMIESYFKDKKKKFIFGAYKKSKNELIGISLVKVLDNREDKEQFKDDLNKINAISILDNNIIGYIKAIGIKKEYQGKGVGSKLINFITQKMKDIHCSIIFTIAWNSGNTFNSSKLLEVNNNYKNIGTIENYWKEDSINRKYYCPLCGNPCNCSATFYSYRF